MIAPPKRPITHIAKRQSFFTIRHMSLVPTMSPDLQQLEFAICRNMYTAIIKLALHDNRL